MYILPTDIGIQIPKDLEESARSICFTGSHGTGKSTSTYAYTMNLKLKYPKKSIVALHENARHSPANKLNKESTDMNQLWIFTNQISTEIEFKSKYDVVICDRSIFDAIAYTRVNGFEWMASSMYKLAQTYANTYDIIILKTIKHCDYLFNDGVRDANDLYYRQRVEDELRSIYRELLDSGSTFAYYEI